MRRFSFQKRFLLVVVLLCGITGTVKAQPGAAASYLPPEHKAAVEQWLVHSEMAPVVGTRRARQRNSALLTRPVLAGS